VTLTLVSLFDGIGGFPLAFERAGVRTVATVEIDTAAAAVSAHHFPDAMQFPDVTEVSADDLRSAGFFPDRGIITAGWPCQDFSVAGRRAGLDGARSGLWWEVRRLLAELRPRWFLGENVPGLLSINDGRDFGAVLGSLAELGYGVAYRILDAQHFGVPQRRERVFIVGHLGEPWTAPAQVLLEPEGCGGDLASGGETGPGAAGGATECVDALSESMSTHTHTHTHNDFDAAGRRQTRLPDRRRISSGRSPRHREVVAALTTSGVGTCGADDNQAQAGHVIVQPLAVRGRDGGAQIEIGPEGGPYNALRAGDGGSSRQSLVCITGERTHALTSEGADASEDGTGRGTPIVAVNENQRGELNLTTVTAPLSNGGGKPGQGYAAVTHDIVVRRLTELECERLQGYPDEFTAGQSGSARYRQLGNSVAVPVVEWIARRLIAVDEAVS
jgi:DNA (cytosine-5)-methyltransferase 1